MEHHLFETRLHFHIVWNRTWHFFLHQQKKLNEVNMFYQHDHTILVVSVVCVVLYMYICVIIMRFLYRIVYITSLLPLYYTSVYLYCVYMIYMYTCAFMCIILVEWLYLLDQICIMYQAICVIFSVNVYILLHLLS